MRFKITITATVDADSGAAALTEVEARLRTTDTKPVRSVDDRAGLSIITAQVARAKADE